MLNNQFAPTTFCLGLLEAPLEAVVETDWEWRNKTPIYSFRRLYGELAEMLRQLEPLTGPLSKHMWVATTAGWTAYFDNSINGSDPWSPIGHLSGRLKCRGLLISCHPDIRGRSYGQCRFDLYGQPPVDHLNLTRSVAATHDGNRWRWDEQGTVQSFENVAAYQNKRIRDRLTPQMVRDYARSVGIDPLDEAQYGRAGTIVSCPLADPSQLRTETYAQARQRLGLG